MKIHIIKFCSYIFILLLLVLLLLIKYGVSESLFPNLLRIEEHEDVFVEGQLWAGQRTRAEKVPSLLEVSSDEGSAAAAAVSRDHGGVAFRWLQKLIVGCWLRQGSSTQKRQGNGKATVRGSHRALQRRRRRLRQVGGGVQREFGCCCCFRSH